MDSFNQPSVAMFKGYNIANSVGGQHEPRHGRQEPLQTASSVAYWDYTCQTSYKHTSGRDVHNATVDGWNPAPPGMYETI